MRDGTPCPVFKFTPMKDTPHDSLSDPNGFDILPAFFVSALHRTVLEYESFADAGSDLNAKSFTAHHTACKTALAHITALLRLHALATKHSTKSDPDTTPELETLLQQARHILAKEEDIP